MKAVRILSVGLLSAWIWGCNQTTEPASHQSGSVNVAPAVNALSKVAALKAGYGITREAASDPEVNPFDSAMAQSLAQLGVCDNFVQLINEIIHADSAAEQTLMNSPRFMNVISCFETEAKNLTSSEDPNVILPIFDKCFCNGSGSVFGALFNVSKYSAPQFNGYSSPVPAKGYGSPTVVPGYSAPAPAPGYSSPSL